MYWFTGFGGLFLFSVGVIMGDVKDAGILTEIAATGLYISGVALIIFTIYKTGIWKKI